MNKTMTYLLAGMMYLLAPAMTAQDAPAQDIPDSIVKKVDPSVVTILHERAAGSGFVITKDGYILTNGHVVQGAEKENPMEPAKLITVVTYDERKYQAKVIGFCLNPDVALIKIESDKDMQPVEFADSRAVRIGEKCFAVGAPIGLKRSFTGGMLSNVDRTDLETYTKVFQTDAAINPGNSGGPLFDQSGRVLGINTYGFGDANNLGFTIPIHVVMVLKDHFLKHGKFIRSDIPFCLFGELTDELAKALKVEKGILIDYVMPGTSADKAGLKAGDLITQIGGQPCFARTQAELLDWNWDITIREPGSKLSIALLRDSAQGRKPVTVDVTLEEAEPMPDTQFPGEIATHRYDALGLGFKQFVLLHKLLIGTTIDKGVLLDLSADDKDGAFAKSGLSRFDIVTRVAGKPVENVEALKRELNVCLARKEKYIDVTASRQKAVVQTTVAPYYDLKGRKVALIAPSRKSEYLDFVMLELMADGADMTLATISDKGPAINPDYQVTRMSIQELNGSNFNAVIFFDGEGCADLAKNSDALRVVKEAFAAKRVLSAIGASSLVLVSGEEAIRQKKITSSEDMSSELIKRKAHYTGSKVESDEKIITTTGFDKDTVRKFVKSFRQMVKSEDVLKQTPASAEKK